MYFSQAEWTFAEISNVSNKESIDSKIADMLTLTLVTNESLKFKSLDAPMIFKWLNYLLTQLKKRSTFAVAIQKFSKTSGDESYLELTKGDLITLDQPGEVLMELNSTWALGTVNDKKAYFPIDSAYILPCIFPPKKEVLDLFVRDTIKQRSQPKSAYNTIQRQKMHNLKKFADENFRPNIE
jgi:myosin VIIa